MQVYKGNFKSMISHTQSITNDCDSKIYVLPHNVIFEDSTMGSTKMDSFFDKYSSVSKSHKKQALFSSTNSRIKEITGTPEMNSEDFQEKIRTVIRGTSSPMIKKAQKDSSLNKILCSFSPRIENQQVNKSRPQSIHTNAYAVTEADDASLNGFQFKTAIKSPNNDDRVSYSKHLYFDQTIATNSDWENNEQQEKVWQGGLDLNKMKVLFQEKDQEKKVRTRMFQKRLVKHDQAIKLRKNLKRKILPAIEDPAEVPMNVYYNLVKYSTNLFRKFVQLSKGLRKHLLFHIFEGLIGLEEKFEEKYSQYFNITGQYLYMTPISFGSEFGVRLDVVLKVQINQEAQKIQGRSVVVGCSYQMENERVQLHNQYQFDLQRAGNKKWMWIHKDERLFHGSTDSRAYTTPIVPINVGESFELSLTLFSLQGSLDTNTVTWNDLKFMKIPNQQDIREYNRAKNLTADRDYFQKYFADLRRVCEVEDTVVEWHDYAYVNTQSLLFHISRVPDLTQFQDQFEVVKVEVGGIDFSVWKVHLRARVNPVRQQKHYFELRMGVTVKSGECCNEVKRSGFLIDRGQDLELRPRDEVVVYLSLGGFEK